MNLKFLPFTLAILFAPALLAQDYTIKLSRPLKVGDIEKISVTSKMAMSTSQTVGDGAPQEQKRDMTVQFDGTEKVLAVDANGKETKVELTVDKFTQTSGGSTTDVAPKGTVITSEAVDKKQTHEVDGKPAEPEVAQALDMVVDLSHGEPSDDEIFGSKDKKKKGDTWDINTDLAKAALATAAAGVEFSDIAGKVTLDDVSGDALKISAEVTGKAKPPLPPTITVDDTSLKATFAGSYPVDTTKYPPEETQEVHISFSAHADGPGGAKVVVKTTVDQSVSRTVTPK